MNILIGLIGIILSFLLVKYRGFIIEITGRFEWAERYLGLGGTYNAIVLFAIVLFFFSFLYLIGEEDSAFGWLFQFVGGKV